MLFVQVPVDFRYSYLRFEPNKYLILLNDRRFMRYTLLKMLILHITWIIILMIAVGYRDNIVAIVTVLLFTVLTLAIANKVDVIPKVLSSIRDIFKNL